jgi:hypothetical protein
MFVFPMNVDGLNDHKNKFSLPLFRLLVELWHNQLTMSIETFQGATVQKMLGL